MLYELEAFRKRSGRTYSAQDITVVIAVRAHEANPWALERLAILAGYYDPAPRVLIVDFGSQEPYRSRLLELCTKGGFQHVYVDDTGVYCPAKARNAGAQNSATDLLFFSDIDCFAEQDLFARLTSAANALDFGSTFDQFLDLPVYHLGADASAAFFTATTHAERSSHLAHTFHRNVYSPFGSYEDYVDPQSNFLLIRRDYFDYIGGMNETFRGHGSEDFELLLRLASYSLRYPMPEAADADRFGPMRREFFGARPYRGFRRLFELMAQQGELAGLRIAHLYHPRGANNTGWYEQNDWRRNRFNEQVLPFLESRAALLGYDWMPRKKQALVLIKNEDHADMLFPLRLAGYKLIPVRPADMESMARAQQMIDERSIDAVAIMNPYMKSHVELRGIFEKARTQGVRTIVVERGALPDSWYYAPDMSYADPAFASLDLSAEKLGPEELALADAYIARLCTGVSTLEANGDFAETMARRAPDRTRFSKVCLIPLQIDDDTAVTQFNSGYLPYATFVDQVFEQASKQRDVLFLIKPHPLSTRKIEARDNVVACDEHDHIHALIELSDAVICYNSGVGLLALIHKKRLATVGNAFYNRAGLGVRASSFQDALAQVFGPDQTRFHAADVRELVAWLISRKYSFFRGESIIRDFGVRKAHAYKHLLWYHLNLDGTRSFDRSALASPVHPLSYATARMGIGRELARRFLPENEGEPQSPPAPANRRELAGRKLLKLLRNPREFLLDSRVTPLRWVGKTIPESWSK